ncbi:hypothetical protein CCR75_004149 [Bremia lactucae]|uniref:RanBP2-type domain-containing protein n=1 Tax=Bremia lactucae TaxID=4779 RepID=A0A976FI42_BRELC|nr:hypothetical protein CCR75_004149 [Bremia lactucae]
MAELDTEHVRLLDAGRQRLGYSLNLQTTSFSSVASKKTQLLQHGNTYGLTFVASKNGFTLTMHNDLQASCSNYTTRRQEAMDHNQKLTLEEIHDLPVTREVQLPSIAYWIALSVDELLLAVAYDDAVALYEVAHILEAATPAPFYTYSKLQVLEMAWSRNSSAHLAIVTFERQVMVCTLEGVRKALDTTVSALSVAWSPSSDQIAVGLSNGTIAIYTEESLKLIRTIAKPACCNLEPFEVHHINWAEETLFLAGYAMYDNKKEETSALACLYDNRECIELNEVVGFYDVEGRQHQYFSVFLPDWRMFFLGCSLSADLELLVSDPEGGEWRLWKPLEQYQARLPMNLNDEDSFPMGLVLNLNATVPIYVDDDVFPHNPIVSCATTEGFLIHFAFVDTTVSEVEFVKRPSCFNENAKRTVTITNSCEVEKDESEFQNEINKQEYGQNDENKFALSNGESSDDEEERKEEEEKARKTFSSIVSDGADYIATDEFPKLFKALGSTYDEEEHGRTMALLDNGGKIYEDDFVAWYLHWIFLEEDPESDEEEDFDLSCKSIRMKSKEEIAAVFSKFTAQEGSWKCPVCMVNNSPDTVKCGACEALNPTASKGLAPVVAASATSAGSIGSSGFSFPVSKTSETTSSSLSFGITSSHSIEAANKVKPFVFAVNGASPAILSANTVACSARGSTDILPKQISEHENGQSDDSISAKSNDGDSSDDEEARNEEDKAQMAFRSIAVGNNDYIKSEKLTQLIKAMDSAYGAEKIDSIVKHLDKNGKIYEKDFVAWHMSTTYSEEDSDSEECDENDSFLHKYGQNDENEFADHDDESSDEDEQRKEEEDTARVTFRTLACKGTDYIATTVFPKLFKAMGSTYDEEVHASTVANLDNNGRIYENDFVTWYVSWIFGDEDLESGDENDQTLSSQAQATKIKSKEEIAAVFSKFTAKEGSWKCSECMVTNSPDAMKCGACEALNPIASKGLAPVMATSATSAGSIGSSGFSFPVSTALESTSSFSFGGVLASSNDTANEVKFSGFSFGDTAPSWDAGFGKAATLSAAATSTSSSSCTAIKSKPSASTSSYPPDTTSKPKPPRFGATNGSGYPPDTTSKPKPPTFGASNGSDYPSDTTSKPKPPTFGTASSSAYPPDTNSKPKLPIFGSTSSGDYPPDTTSKPKPLTFGATSSSGSFQETNFKIKPPVFGQSNALKDAPSSTSFAFNPFGKNLFESKPQSSSSTSTNSAFTFGRATTDKALDASTSSFNVMKPNPFGSTSAATFLPAATSSTRPRLSSNTLSSTLNKDERFEKLDDEKPTKRTLDFGDTSAFDVKANTVVFEKAKGFPLAGPVKPAKDIPSSRMEGQLWKLIIDFDQSLQRVNQSVTTVLSTDQEFASKTLSKVDNLRAKLLNLCNEINSFDESRDQIEKDVLYVIGSDGDVHEQLEYGREILDSFNDEGLKRTLDEQPLDERSKEARELLKKKLSEVDKCCMELSRHIISLKLSADKTGVVSCAHLFRILKQTFDKSKLQYNKACELADQIEKLSLHSECTHQTNRVSGASGCKGAASSIVSKTSMMETILATEKRNQDVRCHFLSLCNNVIKPRDVFLTPRRTSASPAASRSASSSLRVEATSKLMPKTQLRVTSPMSTPKEFLKTISFKNEKSEPGSKLLSLAEAMTPKKEPVKLVSTPQPSVSVGTALQRPSLGTSATEPKPSMASKSNNLNTIRQANDSTTSVLKASVDKDKNKTTLSPVPTFGTRSPGNKCKADTKTAPLFSLGGKDLKSMTSILPSVAAACAPNYKMLLQEFYKVHNPVKTESVVEKTLTTHKGREEALFTKVFTSYLPNSTPEDVKTYINGGPVPPKSDVATPKSHAGPAAKTSFTDFNALTKPSSTSAATTSPFQASQSSFNLSSTAIKPTGFNVLASDATKPASMPSFSTTSSPFGKPPVDYRQKLVAFYQQHNPDKLSSVDATLQKYKGKEDQLFQNLATKYKIQDINTGLSASTSASPFGTPSPFAASGTSNFMAVKPSPSASPFGTPAPTSSPFGVSSGSGFSTFQSTSESPFNAPPTLTPMVSSFPGCVNYREKLTAFYQQYNPAKLSAVEATLEKYKGREDQLFQMLEQKYVKKTTGNFGVSSTSAFNNATRFGTTSAFGSASATPAFGSASTLGAPSAFNAPSAGFGMASRMGGGFVPVATSHAVPSAGFSAFGAQQPTFGQATTQASGFGNAANTGGFGFGTGATSNGFNQSAAFSSSSFTQMR